MLLFALILASNFLNIVLTNALAEIFIYFFITAEWNFCWLGTTFDFHFPVIPTNATLTYGLVIGLEDSGLRSIFYESFINSTGILIGIFVFLKKNSLEPWSWVSTLLSTIFFKIVILSCLCSLWNMFLTGSHTSITKTP